MKATSLALTLPLLVALTAPQAFSQITTPRKSGGPFDHTDVGGIGNTHVIGTSGRDDLSDLLGNDSDLLEDNSNPGDGKRDRLNTYDLDHNDVMIGGLEDEFIGDAGDIIQIWGPPGLGTKKLIWAGTFGDYERMVIVLRRLRNDLIQLWDQWIGIEEPPPTLWPAIVEAAALQLVSLPFDPNSTVPVDLGSTLQLGTFYFGYVPPSPGDMFNWAPLSDSIDPAEYVDNYVMSGVELAAAVDDALVIAVEMYLVAQP